MPIQHRNIPDAELHEPKGAASAVQGTVLVANGGGTTQFKKIGQESLLGLTGGYPSGYFIVSDGAGGFDVRAGAALASLAWTGNGTQLNLVDNPEIDGYRIITNRPGSPWATQFASNVSLINGYYLRPNVSGLFKVTAVMNVSSLQASTDTTAVATFKITTNGSNMRGEVATLRAQNPGFAGAGSAVIECYVNLNTSALVGIGYDGTNVASIVVNSGYLSIELVG